MSIHPARPTDSGSHEGSGTTLLDTVRGELAEERARKESLESRALTLSAAAATATALVFGLGAGYQGRWQTAFFILLGLAGLLLLAASATGWWTVRLVFYERPDLSALRRLVEGGAVPENWPLDLYVAGGLLDTLEDARKQNDEKTKWLDRAFATFLFGALVIGIELVIVVADKVIG